ncbi:MAG: branched-chain amino acid ABC transporter permease [Chloroflexi bacterium HGW-Chloroflexi-4]|nr:MAG: branched-chain amino acid ABC transporter permease [Chloroflexi bacterium HGW-Chloroflexi-4]
MKLLRPILGVVVSLYIVFRLYQVLVVHQEYGADTWTRLLISGLIIGGVYSLIAIGYTLVYGILFMINFAHGEVMMFGAYAGLYSFWAFKIIPIAGDPPTNFLNAYPILAIILAFLIGMTVSATMGFFLEKIAYRPLRKAPRLVPLISAIGASIFLQNAAMLLFSPQLRDVTNPDILRRGAGWTIVINGSNVILPYTGVFTFILSILLLVGLYILVRKSKLGRAMRATALDKKTAALMGVDVDSTISRTFIISGALAGAAGVMWGIHNGLVYYFVGFIPGIKAFTAAVLGGIGNLPGAMVGGLLLGIVESMGPAALGIDFQLKDVLSFLILIFVLTFRPSGLLGEVLSEEKV